jgi:hypothetical protein
MPRRTVVDEPQVEDLDVDTPNEDDETEDVTDAPTESKEKVAKEKKEPARGDLPPVLDSEGNVVEGDKYVTPVGLAHELSKPLDGNAENTDPSNWRYTKSRGADAGSHTVQPQMVYSYIKNAGEKSKNPFPLETVTDSLGKPRQVVKLSAGLAWWDEKNGRAKQRAESAADKAARKEANAAKGEQAEGGPNVEATSVEEAE